MALPLYPNRMTLDMIRREFKGPVGTAPLSQYYAGRGRVRGGTYGFPYGSRTPIPSGGRIALSNFFGAKSSTIIEDYAAYGSYYSGYLWVSQNAKKWFPWSNQPFNVIKQRGSWDGESGTSSPDVYVTQQANATVAFRTAAVTRGDLATCTALPSMANGNIASYMSYERFNIIGQGDMLYLTQTQSSDDYVLSGFYIVDFDTGFRGVVNQVGGDNNGRDSWAMRVRNHTHFGGNWNGGGMSLEWLGGRKLVIPVFNGWQAGSKVNNHNFELQLIHCRGLCRELDLSSQWATQNGNGGYPFLSGGGGASCRPDLFEIAGGVITVKSDIIVFAYFNTFQGGLSIQDHNRHMFAFPQSHNIATCGTRENFTGLIPLIAKAGTYGYSSWMASLGQFIVGM